INKAEREPLSSSSEGTWPARRFRVFGQRRSLLAYFFLTSRACNECQMLATIVYLRPSNYCSCFHNAHPVFCCTPHRCLRAVVSAIWVPRRTSLLTGLLPPSRPCGKFFRS